MMRYVSGDQTMNTNTATLLVVSYIEFLKLLQFVIEKSSFPYHVLTATNTPDALKIFKKSKPDLILAANELADDQQLLKQIRTLPGSEEVPFVIICDCYDQDTITDLGKQGAYIICNPFRPRELWDVIQSCLNDIDTQR